MEAEVMLTPPHVADHPRNIQLLHTPEAPHVPGPCPCSLPLLVHGEPRDSASRSCGVRLLTFLGDNVLPHCFHCICKSMCARLGMNPELNSTGCYPFLLLLHLLLPLPLLFLTSLSLHSMDSYGVGGLEHPAPTLDPPLCKT